MSGPKNNNKDHATPPTPSIGGGAVNVSDKARCRLRDGEPGSTYRVKRLHNSGAIRQRLLDMGFVPEMKLTLVRRAPLNDPIEVQIGNTYVTVRRAEAAEIEVEDV